MTIDGTKKINTTTRMSIAYQLCMFAFESKNDAIIIHEMHTNVSPLTSLELNLVGCFSLGRKSLIQIECLTSVSFLSSLTPSYLYLMKEIKFMSNINFIKDCFEFKKNKNSPQK